MPRLEGDEDSNSSSSDEKSALLSPREYDMATIPPSGDAPHASPQTLYYPVHVGHGSENHRMFAFPSNETHTTKYNAVTFLPRFLFEQYKKATNVCSLSLSLSSSPSFVYHTSAKHMLTNRSSFWWW